MTNKPHRWLASSMSQKVLIGKLTHAGFDDGPGVRVPEVIVIVG